MKKQLLKVLMLVLAIGAGTLSVMAQINWASLGVAPAANQSYYLYNTSADRFLIFNGSSTNAGVTGTNSPASVDGKPFTFDGNGRVVIRQSNTNRTCNAVLNGQQYRLQDNSDTRYYLYLNGATLTRARNSLGSTNYSNWIFIPVAVYNAQKTTLYYSATAVLNAGGTAQVDFVNPVINTSATKTESTTLFGSSKQVTAYFHAEPNSGYRFAGWKNSPVDLDYVSMEPNYSKEFTVTSTNSESPTPVTIYAYFEREVASEYDAQLLSEGGEILTDNPEGGGTPYIGSLPEMLSATASLGGGVILQLLRNVSLTAPVTINSNITFDLNGYTLTPSSSNTLTINASVHLVDNSVKNTGAISVSANVASPVCAIYVADNGILKMEGSVINVSNSSTDAAAKAIGVQVADGGELQLTAGVISAEAGINAIGLEIKAGGEGTLTGGTINATASSNACGIIANGTLVLSDNIKVYAKTTTGSNAYGVQVANSGANVTLNGHTIDADSKTTNAYGIYATAGNVATGGAVIIKAKTGTAGSAYAVKQETASSVVNVQTGRFWTNNTTQDIIGTDKTHLQLFGGYYVHEGALDTYKQQGVEKAQLQGTNRFVSEGYNYVLSNGDNPNYVAYIVTINSTQKYFSSPEDALKFAKDNANSTMIIRQVVPDCELAAGNYTLPANATLLIPYVGTQETAMGTNVNFVNAKSTNSVFRKLTLSTGAHIDVFGKIEVGAQILATTYNADYGTGIPAGQYGQIHMETGSSMTLMNNSFIYAWGYITGAGSIDARNGSKTYECFQINDWPGGSNAMDLNDNTQKVFLANQYAIQNIEVATTYHPGARAYCATGFYFSTTKMGVTITGYAKQTNVQLVGLSGESAMFLLNEADESKGAWVKKEYVSATDRQKYTVNSSASLGSIYIELVIRDATGSGFLGGIAAAMVNGMNATMNSSNYVLPLTCNMSIELQNGDLDITQDVSMLPGAEITMDKQSRVILKGGKSLYLYDSDNWGNYAFSGQKTRYTAYSPSWSTNPRKSISLVDAKMEVSGTLEVVGDAAGNSGIFTTLAGANICSTNDAAGTIRFTYAAPTGESYSDKLYQTTSNTAAIVPITVYPAKLKNGIADPAYRSSKSAAANSSYCYESSEWKNWDNAGCVAIDKTDGDNWIYYAKPDKYVAITQGAADADTHLYYEKTNNENPDTYILIEDAEDGTCQWWKVKYDEESELYHCMHPENNVYYYWDNAWKVKTCQVTWKNWNGTTISTYAVNYKTTPNYAGDQPSRTATAYATYDFIGWTPDLIPVTKDVVYTAVFSETPRQYLITFQDADGSVLEYKYWDYGSTPTPYNAPTPEGKILSWKNMTMSQALGEDVFGISNVTGETTYRAFYTDIPKTEFTIIFQNHDGTVLQSGSWSIGVLPVYDQVHNGTPTKIDSSDPTVTYEWTGGWTPEVVAVDKDAIYTAEFRAVPAKFTITFVNASGEGTQGQIGQPIQYSYGEMPVCPTPPTKQPSQEDINNGISYYEVIWSPLIGTVTGNATYTATGFTAYKAALQVNVEAGAHGAVSVTKDDIEQTLPAEYEWGTQLILTAAPEAGGAYEFVRWSDGNNDNPRTLTVTSPTSLTAEFALKQYTITWKNDEETVLGTTKVNHGEIPTHSTPVKDRTDEYTYTFTDWYPTCTAAISDAIYTAQYSESRNKYTITFVLNNGFSDVVREVEYGQMPSAPTPYKAGQNGLRYEFVGWNPSISTVTGPATYSAQYIVKVAELRAGMSDEATNKDVLITEAGSEADNLVIEKDGSVFIIGSASLEVQDMFIESNGEESGQLLGTSVSRLQINGNAYFDLTLNTQHRVWYAVAVPWEVDAATGISIKGGRQLVLGRDFDLVYYQGSVRATEGPGFQCWKYAEDSDGDKIMHPGRAYMMYFGPQIETIRFKSVSGDISSPVVADVSIYDQTTGNEGDASWNGIANPNVYHARLTAGGANYGYYLNNGHLDEYLVGTGEPTYQLVNLASYVAIVGKPLFIQAENNNPIVSTASITANAPRRIREIEAGEGIESIYEISFRKQGAINKDNMFIQTSTYKEKDGYIVGRDLLKAGIKSSVPQMWINRYDMKLGVNTIAPVDGEYIYPMTLNIPQAGEYTITIDGMQGDINALYLIRNGNVIWNLSNGAYTGSFEQGQETSYSLRIPQRNAPAIVTGIDEAIVNAQGETRKVLINDKVYIIRGEKVYSVDGQLIK